MFDVVTELIDKINIFLLLNKRNEWIYFEFGKIYVRKSKRLYEGDFIDCFDFSSIEIDKEYRGNGFFKMFLANFIEHFPKTNIYVETILNEKLYKYLINQGFEPVGDRINNNLILKR